MPAPIVAAGVSGLFGLLGNRKTDAQKATEGIGQQQSALAGQMGDFARNQYSAGAPAMSQAMNYYRTLAQGNRAATSAVLAPTVAQTTDVYSGAQRGLESKIAPGPGRDVAIADLQRQKAAQLGMMPLMARAESVKQLGDMGKFDMTSALDAYKGAGSALSGAAGTEQRAYNMEQTRQQNYAQIGGQLASAVIPWIFGKRGKTPSSSGGSGGDWTGSLG